MRHTRLDVTIYSFDGKRGRAYLARQGPPLLRWALYEAGMCASRPSRPEHAYFTLVAKPAGEETRRDIGGAQADAALPPPAAP